MEPIKINYDDLVKTLVCINANLAKIAAALEQANKYALIKTDWLLKSAHQSQDENNDKHNAQSSARPISPAMSVGPDGICSDNQKHE